jgi:hypothetical protein
MVLRDNLVHGDLHPGNLLVRRKAADGGEGAAAMEVVMLDAGLCVELTATDQVGEAGGRERSWCREAPSHKQPPPLGTWLSGADGNRPGGGGRG